MAAQSDVGRQSKIVIIAVIAVIVVIGYVAYSYFSHNSTKNTVLPNVNSNNTRGQKINESPKYSEALNNYNKEKASQAEQQGDSYLSVLSAREEDVKKEEEKQKTTKQQQPETKVVYVVQQQANQQVKPRYTKAQLEAILRNWSAQPHSLATTVKEVGFTESIAQSSNISSNTGNKDSNKPVKKIVEDFLIVPAILKTNIDTDENSVVRAYIPAGKYSGAWLYAMGYKRLNNSVDMSFTYMQWQGRSYKVNAKPVDQDTLRTTLSGEVNNRYFTRIVLPAVFNGIGKIGQLYENANTTSVITGSGSVVQNSDTPKSSEIVGSFVGGVGSQASRVLANDAANIPAKQVLVPAETVIGIQFIGPVLETDDLAKEAINQPSSSYPINEPASSPPKQNFSLSPDTESSRGRVPNYYNN